MAQCNACGIETGQTPEVRTDVECNPITGVMSLVEFDLPVYCGWCAPAMVERDTDEIEAVQIDRVAAYE